MKTLFPLIFTELLSEVRDCYISLFGFDVVVEISWYGPLPHGGVLADFCVAARSACSTARS